jgi:hypothetical protein
LHRRADGWQRNDKAITIATNSSTSPVSWPQPTALHLLTELRPGCGSATSIYGSATWRAPNNFVATSSVFDFTARLCGAAFLSSGGYHRHIADNVWSSAGADDLRQADLPRRTNRREPGTNQAVVLQSHGRSRWKD